MMVDSSPSSSSSSTTRRHRHALVVCDMQIDMLMSITPDSRRMAVLDGIQMTVHAADKASWPIIFTKLEFSSGYDSVSPNHFLYGGLRRLNTKLGDDSVHWFLQGYGGTQICSSLLLAAAAASNNATEATSNHDDETTSSSSSATTSTTDITNTNNTTQIICRQQHMPPSRIVQVLLDREVTHVTIVGIKLAYTVQATCQILSDEGFQVTVIRECVADDDRIRQSSLLQYLIPIYANVIRLADFADEITSSLRVLRDDDEGQGSGSEAARFSEFANKKETDLLDFHPNMVRYCCDCGRGGHAAMYMHYLLQQQQQQQQQGLRECCEWQSYPKQEWFVDFMDTYYCPLGKRIVDFCDEPQFSYVSMYIKGREWLDEKEKLISLAGSYMPPTFVIRNGQWVDINDDVSSKPELSTKQNCDDNNDDDVVVDRDNHLVWFVKDVNKNGGRAIQIATCWEDCMRLVVDRPDECYVVQQHIPNPILTTDGRKCHVKFYSLLVCDDKDDVWTLFTYKDAYLSTSPNPWHPNDTRLETQVTVKRIMRLRYANDGDSASEHERNDHGLIWRQAYDSCKTCVKDICGRAIRQGKLQTRRQEQQHQRQHQPYASVGKKQFEIFSADFMWDTSGRLWIIEFNFSPVLYDPTFVKNKEDQLTTPGLKLYHELYLQQGEKAQVNDGPMIRDAVSIVFYPEERLPTTTLWEQVAQFQRRGDETPEMSDTAETPS